MLYSNNMSLTQVLRISSILLLTGCAIASQQSPVQPKVDTAKALQAAEARGYAEGLAAGRRIQARHDKQAPASVAQQACPPSAAAAPEPAQPTAAKPVQNVAPYTPPNIFIPIGPARPLSSQD